MATDDLDGPPTMSGYLAFKSRVAAGDEALNNKALQKAENDWLAYFVDDNLAKPPKSAIAHYQDALDQERTLKNLGADDPAARARLTGIKMREFEDKKEPGTRNEWLFRAKTAADRDLSQAAQARSGVSIAEPKPTALARVGKIAHAFKSRQRQAQNQPGKDIDRER